MSKFSSKHSVEPVFYPEERTAVFIDGANLYMAAKNLDFEIDYAKLLIWLRSKVKLVRANYYTAILEDEEFVFIRPLVDWLDYNGFNMITKPTKEFVDAQGRRKIKGNMDIEIAVDLLEAAANVDHVILFSGDSDFRSLVEAAQRKGVRVTVISTLHSNPPMVADELRRQADSYLDLAQIKTLIEKVRSDIQEAA